MFDRYVIGEEGFRNLTADGKVIGFQLRVRIGYYRGLVLSMVEGFDVSVDGERYPRQENLFEVRGRTFTFAQMETEYDERWEMGEYATVTVPRPGGLAPGKHQLDVTEFLRVSYIPVLTQAHDRKELALEP